MSLATRIQIVVAKSDLILCEIGESIREALPVMLIMLALIALIAVIKRQT